MWETKGSGRKPASHQSSGALCRHLQEDSHTLSVLPRVNIWLWEASEPSPPGSGQGAVRGLWASQRPEITGSQSQASQTLLDTGEELRTKWRLQGTSVNPGAEERREQGELGFWVVPTLARVLGPFHGWSTERPSSWRLDTTL